MSLPGSTLIYHDLPEGGYRNHSNVYPTINYEINMNQIVALIDESHTCRQFLRMETFNTYIYHGHSAKRWKTRQGGWAVNWGTPTGVGGCPCHLTKGKHY